jgi:hypothetical protein
VTTKHPNPLTNNGGWVFLHYKGVIFMNREYISVIIDDKPTVIFKRNIIAVSKSGAHTEITCVSDVVFYTKEDYASVVKKIIG